jgi:hypothetical protein
VVPARVTRVEDEPARAGGDEPGLGLLERGFGNHRPMIGGVSAAAVTAAGRQRARAALVETDDLATVVKARGLGRLAGDVDRLEAAFVQQVAVAPAAACYP